MQSKTFRLFISSTFSDFNEERRLLQTYVFPKVKDYCSGKGYTFQPIDLRWGVSNKAQLDQKTLELCINEVHASKLQPHPNFLIMAGDRYGWVPCPYAIEAGEYNTIFSKVTSKEDQALLDKWYQLDNNQIPASYILKERAGQYADYNTWAKDEEQLREILQIAVELTNLDTTSKEQYFDSATEQEVFNGIIKYKDKTKFQKDELINKNKDYESLDESHVYGYIRNIKTVEGSEPEADTEFFDKKDLQPRISDFKQQLRDSIKNDNLLEVDADLTNFNKDEKNKSLNYEYDGIVAKPGFIQGMVAYLVKLIGFKGVQNKWSKVAKRGIESESTFVTGMVTYLKQSIDKFDKHIASIGLDEPEAIEIESQRVFKDDKAKGFIGREDDLEAIQSYIKGDNNQALVIYGPSGMGKSALMAKAIEQTEDKHKNKQKILYRFVASTASLSTSIEVLISMLKELGIEESIQITKDDSGQDKSEELQEFFARVSGHLSSLTEPTTIFIDAVDQFTNKDALEDGYEFIWLPKQLPDNLKIVISALEDDKYKEDSKYLELLKTKISNQDNLHKLEPFNDKHAEEMIDGILGQYKRSTTPEQQNYLFEQPDSKQPLYLSIAAQELKHWKSTDVTKAYQAKGEGQDLAPTQREIIDEYIQNLTELYHHDQDLVHRVVSYLHLTDGLSESELLEILSTDEDFIDHIAPDTYHNKTEKQLPVVIWARLHSQLKPFLKLEKKDGQETMGFFHREFDSAIKEQENIQQTHENLIKLVLELMQKYQDQPFDSNRYGKLYIELIAEHYRRYKDQEALEQYGRDIATIENENYLEAITLKLIQMGIDLQEIMQIPESIIYLTSALSCTDELYQENPSVWVKGYAPSLGNLAFSYGNNNQVEQAIGLQEKALAITEALYQKNPSVWAEVYSQSLNNLAISYQSNNQIDAAISLQEKALAITEALYQKNPSVWAEVYIKSLNNLAISYQSNNQIDAAISLQEKALTITEALYQETPSVWAMTYTTSLNNLAIFYKSNNQVEQAIALQEKALAITEALYQENPSVWAKYYATSLGNLAISYQSNNQVEQAIALQAKALAIREVLYQENPSVWAMTYATSLNNLASYYANNNQAEQAISLQEKALEITKALYQENPSVWAEGYTRSLNNLASSYGDNNQVEQAISLQEKALEITKPLYQENPSVWAKGYTVSLNNLAIFYKSNNQVEQAIALQEKALEITKPLYQETPSVWVEAYTRSLNNLALSYANNNQVEQAISLQEKALEITKPLYQENPSVWAKGYTVSLNHLAMYYSKIQDGPQQFWYENGQKKTEVNYKDSKEEGLTTQWHENGQKKSERNFKDGKDEGLATWWHENGQKKNEGNYKDGKQDGLETVWFENGQKKGERSFTDGKEEGLVTLWHENGQKELEINHKDGKEEGLATQWHENGQKKGEFNFKDGKKDGLTTQWHENGQKKAEINYKDDKQEGLTTWWHENGQKKAEYNYKDDKKDGLETQWHENGQKRGEINFKDGKNEGLETQWYENGQKRGEINFKDGKIEGLVTWWYKNGPKNVENNFMNGKLDGLTISWHEDGTKAGETIFKDGVMNGSRIKFSRDGSIIYSATYNNGESNNQNGLDPQYDDEGAPTHYIEYKDGVVVNERVEIKE